MGGALHIFSENLLLVIATGGSLLFVFGLILSSWLAMRRDRRRRKFAAQLRARNLQRLRPSVVAVTHGALIEAAGRKAGGRWRRARWGVLSLGVIALASAFLLLERAKANRSVNGRERGSAGTLRVPGLGAEPVVHTLTGASTSLSPAKPAQLEPGRNGLVTPLASQQLEGMTNWDLPPALDWNAEKPDDPGRIRNFSTLPDEQLPPR